LDGAEQVEASAGSSLINALFGPRTEELDFGGVRIHKLDETVAERAGILQEALVSWTDEVCDTEDQVEAKDMLCQGVRELGSVIEAMLQTLEERQILDRRTVGERALAIASASALDPAVAAAPTPQEEERAFQPTRNWPGQG